MLYRDALSRAATTLALVYPLADQTLTPMNNDTPERESFLFRADLGDAGKAVLKVAAPDRLNSSATRLIETHPLMQTGRYRVPQPLHYAPTTGVLIMEDARGETAQSLWLRGGDDATRALQSAGGWIAAFHKLSRNQAAFNPDPHLNWLRKAIAAHLSGTRRIPKFDTLAQLVPQIEALAEAARNTQSLRCVTHRDFHLRNLILRKLGRCYGLDFENGARDEAMRDLLFFLTDAARLAPDQPAPSALRAMASSLGAAYGRPPADPAARLFFQRCFALNGWAALDEMTGPLGPKRLRQLKVLRALYDAEDLFADIA